MKNAEWLIKHGYNFSDVRYLFGVDRRTVIFYINNKFIGKCGGDSYLEAFALWLDHEYEPTLTDVERQYLTMVIKPFRDNVKYIVKRAVDDGRYYYYLDIWFKDGSDDMLFPRFPSNSMYVGLELEKNYTLEDLEL